MPVWDKYLNGHSSFCLTLLPNGLIMMMKPNHGHREKSKMATATTATREDTYNLDGLQTESVTLTKQGDDGKEYSVPATKVKFTSVNDALSFYNNDTERFLRAVEISANNQLLAGPRQKLAKMAEGPLPTIADIAENLTGFGISEDDAVAKALESYAAVNPQHTYTRNDVEAYIAKRNEKRAALKKYNEDRKASK